MPMLRESGHGIIVKEPNQYRAPVEVTLVSVRCRCRSRRRTGGLGNRVEVEPITSKLSAISALQNILDEIGLIFQRAGATFECVGDVSSKLTQLSKPVPTRSTSGC